MVQISPGRAGWTASNAPGIPKPREMNASTTGASTEQPIATGVSLAHALHRITDGARAGRRVRRGGACRRCRPSLRRCAALRSGSGGRRSTARTALPTAAGVGRLGVDASADAGPGDAAGDLGLVLLAAAGDDRHAVAQGVLDAAVAAVGDVDVGPWAAARRRAGTRRPARWRAAAGACRAAGRRWRRRRGRRRRRVPRASGR